jgi:hypothetical protein
MMRGMELPLASWLKTILEIVNERTEPNPVTARLGTRLQQLIEDTLPLRRHFQRPLPPVFVSLRGRSLGLLTDLGPSDDVEVEEINKQGYLRWIATQHRDELEGAIYALSADPLGARVRRCDHCHSFFIVRRNHRRKRHFCRPEHRRAFDHSHRDPKKQAAYMRDYRQTLAERARTRRKRH